MRTSADRFVTVYAARTYDTQRQPALFHFTYLNIAGVRAQQPVGILMYIKCILHITRRMMFRKIKCGEVVPVVFYFGTFCYGKTKPLKNFDNIIAHQAYRMTASQWYGVGRKSKINFWGSRRIS